MAKSAIQFGAGNIGRGFIGILLAHAGYELIFVDVIEHLITVLSPTQEMEILVLGKVDLLIVVTGKLGGRASKQYSCKQEGCR